MARKMPLSKCAITVGQNYLPYNANNAPQSTWLKAHMSDEKKHAAIRDITRRKVRVAKSAITIRQNHLRHSAYYAPQMPLNYRRNNVA